jgi:hypothetical protein
MLGKQTTVAVLQEICQMARLWYPDCVGRGYWTYRWTALTTDPGEEDWDVCCVVTVREITLGIGVLGGQ